MSAVMILPTTLEGHRGKEIAPDIWLISDPTFYPELREWRALVNTGGALAVAVLRVYIGADATTNKGVRE